MMMLNSQWSPKFLLRSNLKAIYLNLFFLAIAVQSHYIHGVNYLTGYDPIRSVYLAPVFNFTFERKLTSNMEKHTLVPDQVVERTHSTGVFQLNAEKMSRTTEYTQVKDMKASVSAKWLSFFASGSYEHKQMTKNFAERDIDVYRVSASITTHDIVLLDENVIDNIRHDLTEMYRVACYLNYTDPKTAFLPASDYLNWLVDNFYFKYGTHHVNRATFGGVIAVDFVVKSTETQDMTEDQVKASASAGFGSIFKVSGEYSTDTTHTAKFKQSVKNQFVTTCGGHPWNENMTVQIWEDSLYEKPCLIDYEFRSTVELLSDRMIDIDDDPVHKSRIMHTIIAIFQQRQQRYFEQNTMAGCTDQHSANFRWYANLDDGSCQTQPSHTNYGGFWTDSNCHQYDTINHDTEAKSCRSPYTPRQLVNEVFVQHGGFWNRVCRTHHDFIFRHTVCDNEWSAWSKSCHQTVQMCYNFNTTVPAKGYYMGGIYTSDVPNFVTGKNNCPTGFHDRIMFIYEENKRAMHICEVGEDEVANYPSGAIRFGGIFNCHVPHPLTLDYKCPAGYLKMGLGQIQSCDWWYCIWTDDINHKTYYYPPGYGTDFPNFPTEMFNNPTLIATVETLRMMDLNRPMLGIKNETKIDDVVVEKDTKHHHEKNNLSTSEIFVIILSILLGLACLVIMSIVGILARKKPRERYSLNRDSVSYHSF